jgi:hypothetical protein
MNAMMLKYDLLFTTLQMLKQLLMLMQVSQPFKGTRPQAFVSYNNNVLSYDMNRLAGTSYTHKPRGSWKINGIYFKNDDGTTRLPQIDDTVLYVSFTVTEPLLLSPFVFGSNHDKQGFYGIQGMQFTMNMQATANRAWRCISQPNGVDDSATLYILIRQLLLAHSAIHTLFSIS